MSVEGGIEAEPNCMVGMMASGMRDMMMSDRMRMMAAVTRHEGGEEEKRRRGRGKKLRGGAERVEGAQEESARGMIVQEVVKLMMFNASIESGPVSCECSDLFD